MKYTVLYSLLIATLSPYLPAAPDFPAHGFTSTLPESTGWELQKQVDDTVNDIVIRGFLDANGQRSVTLIMGRNSTAEKELDVFAKRYVARLAQGHGLTIMAKTTRALGGARACLISSELNTGSGLQYSLTVLVANEQKMYICMLSSTLGKVEDDRDLMVFLNSVQIEDLK